jgi:NAD(P)-dependent dehydrogenase (short-subunit alcohol dehydrogenase family)
MTKILDGKRALVTGGSRGIGRAIAEAFVSAGARMVIADIEGAAAAAEEIGRGTVGVACDVASSESVAAGIAEAVRALGGLDLLVNNAGVGSLAPLHELTEEEFDRVVAVNLRGTWLVQARRARVGRRRRGDPQHCVRFRLGGVPAAGRLLSHQRRCDPDDGNDGAGAARPRRAR